MSNQRLIRIAAHPASLVLIGMLFFAAAYLWFFMQARPAKVIGMTAPANATLARWEPKSLEIVDIAIGREDKGWASDRLGRLFRVDGDDFRFDANGSDLITDILVTLGISGDGSAGFAFGNGGTVLRLENGEWRIDSAASNHDRSSRVFGRSVVLNEQGDRAWAVSESSEIFLFKEGAWKTVHPAWSGLEFSHWEFDTALDSGWVLADGLLFILTEAGLEQAEGPQDISFFNLNHDATRGWAFSAGGVWALGDGTWSIEDFEWEQSRFEAYNQPAPEGAYLVSDAAINFETNSGMAVGPWVQLLLVDGKWEELGDYFELEPTVVDKLIVDRDTLNGFAFGGRVLEDSGFRDLKVFRVESGRIASDYSSTELVVGDIRKVRRTSGGKHGAALSYDKDSSVFGAVVVRGDAIRRPAFVAKNLLSVAISPDGERGLAVGENSTALALEEGVWRDRSKNINTLKCRHPIDLVPSLFTRAVRKSNAEYLISGSQVLFTEDDKLCVGDALATATRNSVYVGLTRIEKDRFVAMTQFGRLNLVDGRGRWVDAGDASTAEMLNQESAAVNKFVGRGLVTTGHDLGVRYRTSRMFDYFSPTREGFLTDIVLASDWKTGWISGQNGLLLERRPTGWEAYQLGIGNISLNRIRMNGDHSKGWIVGDEQTILAYANDKWTEQPTGPESNNLYDVWINSAGTSGWAVGDDSTILRLSEGQWSAYRGWQFGALRGVALTDDETVGWIVGDQGLLELNPYPIGAARLTRTAGSAESLSGDFLLELPATDIDWSLHIADGSGRREIVRSDDERVSKSTEISTRFSLDVAAASLPVQGRLVLEISNQFLDETIELSSGLVSFSRRTPASAMSVAALAFYVVLNFWVIFAARYHGMARRFLFASVEKELLRLILGRALFAPVILKASKRSKRHVFGDFAAEFGQSDHMKTLRCDHYVDIQLAPLGEESDWPGFQQVCKRAEPCLILADSGMGKTTLLVKWYDQVGDDTGIPVFVELGRGDIATQVALQLRKHGGADLSTKQTNDLLNSGGFVIFLDALNETHTDAGLEQKVARLSQKNKVILSSQIDPGWQNIDAQKFEILPFTIEQVGELIGEQWIEELKLHEFLSSDLSIPKNTQLLKDFIQTYNKLPKFYIDIYDELAIRLHKSGDDSGSAVVPRSILKMESLALESIERGLDGIREREDVSSKFLEEAKAVGILSKRDGRYHFWHEKIHCYFVSRRIARELDIDRLRQLRLSIMQAYPSGRFWAATVEMMVDKIIKDSRDRYTSVMEILALVDGALTVNELLPRQARYESLGLIVLSDHSKSAILDALAGR